jgi:hypothetical protein
VLERVLAGTAEPVEGVAQVGPEVRDFGADRVEDLEVVEPGWPWPGEKPGASTCAVKSTEAAVWMVRWKTSRPPRRRHRLPGPRLRIVEA